MRPIDMLLTVTCDRDQLVEDVYSIAKKTNRSMLDCWNYLRDHSGTPNWMKVISIEKIETTEESNLGFWREIQASINDA